MKKELGFACAALSALLIAGCACNTATTKDEAPVAAATAAPPATAGDKGVSATPVRNDVAARPVQEPAGVFDKIYFGFDTAALSDEATKTLAATAKQMTGYRGVKTLKIEGHCDERGSAEYNMALGEKRALAAKNYLLTLGVPADQISVISFGKERPADPAHNEDAWARNRRDEFRLE